MQLFLNAIFLFFRNSVVAFILFIVISAYILAYNELKDEDDEEDDYKNNHWKNKY